MQWLMQGQYVLWFYIHYTIYKLILIVVKLTKFRHKNQMQNKLFSRT